MQPSSRRPVSARTVTKPRLAAATFAAAGGGLPLGARSLRTAGEVAPMRAGIKRFA